MKASLFVLVFVLIVLAVLVALMPSGAQAQISEPATPAFDCASMQCSVYLPDENRWTCVDCIPTPIKVPTLRPVISEKRLGTGGWCARIPWRCKP